MPYKQTATQCVVRLVALRLPTGAQRPPLLLPLPEEYRHANLRRAELTWRADHYELCLTLDTGETLPPPLPAGDVAGVDLGEVHIAAVTTTQRHALVASRMRPFTTSCVSISASANTSRFPKRAGRR
jgi:transposase